MRVFVGTFSEREVADGLDRVCIADTQERTGLVYTDVQIIRSKGKIVEVSIWLCDFEDLTGEVL